MLSVCLRCLHRAVLGIEVVEKGQADRVYEEGVHERRGESPVETAWAGLPVNPRDDFLGGDSALLNLYLCLYLV